MVTSLDVLKDYGDLFPRSPNVKYLVPFKMMEEARSTHYPLRK